MRHESTDIAGKVREVGPEEVGRRYLSADAAKDDDWWIFEAVWFGSGLDDDTHLAVVLGALDAASDNPDALWRIGDQPEEEGLFPRAGMPERLLDLRRTTPSLVALWAVMRNYYRDVLHITDSIWES
ncbi:MAG: hypothetical protein M3450_08780 [Actinomycetota bacterium]|nr:hypothetical protein [Actinomycetota bacterium]